MAYIESIKLSNFRNYESLELSFDKGTNIFYGDNAQGKQTFWNLSIFAGRANPTKEARIKKLFGLTRRNPISG